jgi:lysozyme
MTAVVGVKAQLRRDEGVVEYAYQDSMLGKCQACGKSNGFWTIGVGHLIDKRRGGKLPAHIIGELLDWDISEKTAELYKAFPWIEQIDEVRRAVLINMAFQLGVLGLSRFGKALYHMRSGQWEAAATEFADSLVARVQTPERWARHCKQITTGEWQ